jgi:HEAT repeat protein
LDVLPTIEAFAEPQRARVLRALGDSGDPQWTPRIVAELDAAHPAVREAAIEALGRLGDRTAIEALTPYAKRVGNTSTVTRAARQAIAAIRERLDTHLVGALTLTDGDAHGQLALAPDPGDDDEA